MKSFVVGLSIVLLLASCASPKSGGPHVTIAFADQLSKAEPIEVADEFMRPLRTVPFLGRMFIPSDFRRGSPKYAIVSFDLWSSDFGSRRDIIGGKLVVAGEEYVVVAIAPPKVRDLAGRKVWLPKQN